MRGVWGGLAAACMIATVAMADDQGSEGTAQDNIGRRFLFFAGADVWRTGAFAHAGAMWSPGGLDHEGFTVKVIGSGGEYRYDSGALGLQVTGQQILVAAMAGWRFKLDRLEVTAYVGPDFEDFRLTPDDPGTRMRGRYFGVRGGVDVWYEPMPGWMAAFNASGGTAGEDYSVRAAVGWRVLDRAFIGPEAQGFGCPGYEQLRVGAHLTGLKFGLFEWSAAGGWTEDSDHRSGAYGRLGLLTRY